MATTTKAAVPTQKDYAIKCLETLRIYKPYIRKFKSKATMPCFFEAPLGAGYYVDQEEKLYKKIKEIEAESGCLVYAVTHDITPFGEFWSMLCVPESFAEEPEVLTRIENSNDFYAFAYVWNESSPWCSEFGDIVVKSIPGSGGIYRKF